MQTPPPFPGQVPKKSNNTLLWVVLLVIGVVVVVPCIGIVGAGFWTFKNVMPMAGCAVSYSHIDDALRAYAAKNEGKLPPVTKWQDELRPFYKEEIESNQTPFDVFPADGEWSCTTGSTKTGIAMNSELDGKKLEELKKDDVIFFEVAEVGTNQKLKYQFKSKSSSPKIFGSPRGWLTITAEGFDDSSF